MTMMNTSEREHAICEHGCATARRDHRPRRAGGFTLIELIIVVLVMGILTAVAVPRVADMLTYHRVESAAGRIKADLTLARRHAMSTSADVNVFFYSGANWYTLSGGVEGLGGSPNGYAVYLAKPPYDVSIISAQFGKSTAAVFNGYGVPNEGGEVVIESGGYARTIRVDGQTGEATIL